MLLFLFLYTCLPGARLRHRKTRYKNNLQCTNVLVRTYLTTSVQEGTLLLGTEYSHHTFYERLKRDRMLLHAVCLASVKRLRLLLLLLLLPRLSFNCVSRSQNAAIG